MTFWILWGIAALALIVSIIVLWRAATKPDEEQLAQQRLSARPYDTEILDDAFDGEPRA